MSDNNPTLTIIDKMVAIQPVISLISGRCRLQESDLNLPSDEPIPAELISLGSKKVIDPAHLRIFLALKAKAITYLEKHCLHFLNGGYLCPQDLANEVVATLEGIRQEFLTAKARFLMQYDDLIKQWVQANKSYKDILEGYALAKSYVAKNISCDFFLYNISTTSPNANIAPLISNLGEQLIDEIVKEACDARKSTFTDRASLCRKSLRPLKALSDKLHDLSFVNPDASIIENLINGFMDRLPTRGKLDGILSIGIYSLVDTLCDKQKLMATVENAKNDSTSNVIDSFFIQEQATQQTQEVVQAPVEILIANEPALVTDSNTSTSSYVDPCGMW